MNRGSLEFHYSESPQPGDYQEVTEGVFWVRMPMPFALDHINLWLLREDDGWTIIDTGLATESTVNCWTELEEKLLGELPIKRVIVTHMHPDHIGLAGWLCREDYTDLWMSHGEYMQGRVLIQDTNREAPKEAISFYHSAGFDERQLDHYSVQFGSYGKLIRAVPNAFSRLSEGNCFEINGYQWRVLVGYGHSPEHVCLLCEELGIFISGDQLLPNISSNVSVWPLEPQANPLKQWLESCERLKHELPESVLVLPSHGLPFRGAHHRLQMLIEEHEADLVKLHEFCREPKRAVDVFDLLFKSEIDKHKLVMATGESVAHFHCLMQRGLVQRSMDDNGVYWYQSL